MAKNSSAAGTSPFAHLMSGFRGKRAEEEKPEDDEARKARRAEEDKQREDENARRAEEDQRRDEEDARRAEEDGPPADDEDDKDGKRGKKAADDDQDPEADDGDDEETCAEEDMDDDDKKAFRSGLALGRVRENARCARIFGQEGAAVRPDLAATLAFTTRNSSGEAGRLLGTVGAGKPRGRGLDDRMAARPEPRPGADGGAGKPNFGDRVQAAVNKVRGVR